MIAKHRDRKSRNRKDNASLRLVLKGIAEARQGKHAPSPDLRAAAKLAARIGN